MRLKWKRNDNLSLLLLIKYNQQAWENFLCGCVRTTLHFTVPLYFGSECGQFDIYFGSFLKAAFKIMKLDKQLNPA